MLKYDLHNHTHYSRCSNNKPELLLKTQKKKGANGIAVTDHHTIKGAVKIKRMNKDRDFEVIIGEEISTQFGDVLALYLNEEIKTRDLFSLLDNVRKQDGLIIIPHPYRVSFPTNKFRYPLEKIRNKINAIECFNARMLPGSNPKAEKLAKRLNIAGTGGSDAHFKFEILTAYTVFQDSLRRALREKRTGYGGTTLYGPFGGFLSFCRNRLPFFRAQE